MPYERYQIGDKLTFNTPVTDPSSGVTIERGETGDVIAVEAGKQKLYKLRFPNGKTIKMSYWQLRPYVYIKPETTQEPLKVGDTLEFTKPFNTLFKGTYNGETMNDYDGAFDVTPGMKGQVVGVSYGTYEVKMSNMGVKILVSDDDRQRFSVRMQINRSALRKQIAAILTKRGLYDFEEGKPSDLGGKRLRVGSTVKFTSGKLAGMTGRVVKAQNLTNYLDAVLSIQLDPVQAEILDVEVVRW